MKPRLWYLLFFSCLLLVACRARKNSAYTAPPATTPPAATQQPKPATPPNDMQVVISEEMLNKSFKALGPISGREAYSVLFINDSFSWTLINPQIHLHPGNADFTTDVKVVAGPLTYTTACLGDVSIWYDRQKNLINVKITKCIVEIYTKVLGTKVHLKDIDIADQFTEPFTFEGPTATNTFMDMEMPDGSIRRLYMTATDCDLTVQEKQLVVPCEVNFSLTPPPASKK